MFVKSITLLLVIGSALAEKPFAGVDPNSLSCDPQGQVYLLLPHFTACTKFFMCAHGEEVEFSCSGGLIFDFELQGCNWEWDATCVLREPPTEEDEPVEGSGEGSGYPEGSGDGEDIEGSGDPVADSEYFSQVVLNCRDSIDVNRQVSFKGDCQRYWRCVDGLPRSLYCSDGFFFNESIQRCDLEANVQCNAVLEDELNGEFLVY